MVEREIRVGDWSSVHDNSTNEMLRKTRQHNTAGRQSNTTSHKAVIFQRKPQVRLEPTTFCVLDRCSYQLSY